MNLINKQKIEEAAKDLFKDCNTKQDQETVEMFRRIFIQGAQFSQNEITPLFCECMEWVSNEIRKDNWVKFKPEIGLWYYNFDHIKTQQLFELWLSEREK